MDSRFVKIFDINAHRARSDSLRITTNDSLLNDGIPYDIEGGVPDVSDLSLSMVGTAASLNQDPTENRATILHYGFKAHALALLTQLGPAFCNAFGSLEVRLKGVNYSSDALNTSSSIIAMIANLGLNEDSTVKHGSILIGNLRKGKLVSDQPGLSWKQKTLVYGMTAIPATTAVALHSYYAFNTITKTLLVRFSSLQSVPFPVVLSAGASFAVVTAIGTLLTEGAETHETALALVSGKPSKTGKLNQGISITAASIAFLVELVSYYLAMKQASFSFSDNNAEDEVLLQNNDYLDYTKYPFVFFSTMKGIAMACYIRTFTSHTLDATWEYVSKKKFEPTKVLMFTTALALSVYLGLMEEDTNVANNHEIANDFGIDYTTITDPLFDVLAWFAFIYQGGINTASLIDPVRKIASTAWHITATGLSKGYRLTKSGIDSIRPDTPSIPTTPETPSETLSEVLPLLNKPTDSSYVISIHEEEEVKAANSEGGSSTGEKEFHDVNKNHASCFGEASSTLFHATRQSSDSKEEKTQSEKKTFARSSMCTLY